MTKKRPAWERGLYRLYFVWSAVFFLLAAWATMDFILGAHFFADPEQNLIFLIIGLSPWPIHQVVRWIVSAFKDEPPDPQ